MIVEQAAALNGDRPAVVAPCRDGIRAAQNDRATVVLPSEQDESAAAGYLAIIGHVGEHRWAVLLDRGAGIDGYAVESIGGRRRKHVRTRPEKVPADNVRILVLGQPAG